MVIATLRDKSIVAQPAERVTRECRPAPNRYGKLDGAYLGEWVRDQRKAWGYSQDGLAAQLGLRRSNISEWETGRNGDESSVLFVHMPQLAAAFGMSVHEALCGTGLEQIYRSWYIGEHAEYGNWSGWCIDIQPARPVVVRASVAVVTALPASIQKPRSNKPRALVNASWRYGSLLECAA